jgi:HEAT repeat protein
MKIRLKQEKETILKLLKTANINKKLRILNKLNGTNEKENIKILLKVLEDSSWTLRERAAHKLAKYGKRVIPRLKKVCYKGHWFARASACLSLGEIGNAKALDSIVKLLLTDNNPTVIKESSLALVKIAEKMPLEFSKYLKEMKLEHSQILKILTILEISNIDVYGQIRETLGHE